MRVSTYAVVALLATGSAAHADWQFTRWGMTPEQVVKASHGAATQIDPSTSSYHGTNGSENLVTMPYKTGSALSTAKFIFTHGKLSSVYFADAPTDLDEPLHAKYGPPDETDPRGVAGPREVWYSGQDQIVYERDLKWLEYRPRLSASNSGL